MFSAILTAGVLIVLLLISGKSKLRSKTPANAISIGMFATGLIGLYFAKEFFNTAVEASGINENYTIYANNTFTRHQLGVFLAVVLISALLIGTLFARSKISVFVYRNIFIILFLLTCLFYAYSFVYSMNIDCGGFPIAEYLNIVTILSCMIFFITIIFRNRFKIKSKI